MATEPETREHLKNAPRIDMRPKVTGSAKYIEDLPEPAPINRYHTSTMPPRR